MTWDGEGTDPWLPWRIEARAEIAGVERDIRNAVWAALSNWLVQTGRRVLRGDAPPDLDAVWARAPAWREAVDAIVNGQILRALRIAYRSILGEDFAWEQRTFVGRYLAEVRNRLTRLPDEVFDLVSGQVAQGVNLGEGIPELAERVEQVFSLTDSERWENRATTVARTEAIGAMNAGRLDAFRAAAEAEPDIVFEKMWLATEDARTRPEHREADGQRVPLEDAFTVGGFSMMFPGDPTAPADLVINCVVGSTQVTWPGQVIAGSTARSHYGTFIEFVTAEGHHLTITPNHPVLTPSGYVPAGLLSPGQSVMGTLTAPAPDVQHAPSRIEQVHRSLREAGQTKRVVGSRMDFHGDGTNAEVEVVGADGYLPSDFYSSGPGDVQDLDLLRPGGRTRPLSGLSEAVVLLRPAGGDSTGRLAPSLVGRTGQGPSVGGAEAGHADTVGVASAPDIEAQLNEAPDDGRTAGSDFPAHLQYALAAGMAPTEIIEVKRYTAHHWVYNLSTSDHWFTGNGIALHNCRCSLILLEQGEEVDFSDRQMKRSR